MAKNPKDLTISYQDLLKASTFRERSISSTGRAQLLSALSPSGLAAGFPDWFKRGAVSSVTSGGGKGAGGTKMAGLPPAGAPGVDSQGRPVGGQSRARPSSTQVEHRLTEDQKKGLRLLRESKEGLPINDENIPLGCFFISDNYHIPSQEEMYQLHTIEEIKTLFANKLSNADLVKAINEMIDIANPKNLPKATNSSFTTTRRRGNSEPSPSDHLNTVFLNPGYIRVRRTYFFTSAISPPTVPLIP